MRYITPYKLFESIELDEYNQLMGRLLHVYGSIPVPKEKSSVVIKRILSTPPNNFFKLGQDIDLSFSKIHYKIRFSDYFDSLLEDKDVRGHNFEGLITGLFNGDLSTRGAKFDCLIDEKKFSVKFVDHKGKAPEIGTFKNILIQSGLMDLVTEKGGLTSIFLSSDEELKAKVWTSISIDIDYWLIAYPDNEENPNQIIVNILDKDSMSNFINNGYVTSPKKGLKDFYSLALSTRYIKTGKFNSFKIKIPKVTLEELREEYKDFQVENFWAKNVFGNLAYKMRPDVLRWIKTNKDLVIKKLSEI